MDVIIKIFLILSLLRSYSQQKHDSLISKMDKIAYVKDTIFIKYRENNVNEEKFKGIKFYNKEENGIVFNHIKKGSFLFRTNSKSDTLCVKQLVNYELTTVDEVDKKEEDFRNKTKDKLPIGANDKLYQFYDKNDIFFTYLIEVLEKEKKIIVYPVKWRNEGDIQINTRF